MSDTLRQAQSDKNVKAVEAYFKRSHYVLLPQFCGTAHFVREAEGIYKKSELLSLNINAVA
jgi:hypothetical protein